MEVERGCINRARYGEVISRIRVLSMIILVIFAGSLESANSSILASRRHFKEVVGEKIRILL